jgi:hypothetical protein
MRAKAKGAADPRSVSHRLRKAILAEGSTAYALGRRARVDPGMIQRFVNGERGLALDSVDRVALALGLRLVEAARGRGRPARPARPKPDDAPALGPMAEVPDPDGGDELSAELALSVPLAHPGESEPDHSRPSETTPDHPCPLADGPGCDGASGASPDDQGDDQCRA